ncbi:type IV toxin-antitoxin system AbiEi family antitoxin domain-containing protein [Natrinema sp. 1APR25-10V2]|uniref:type IV toxin-antitoxin system AbiEi family antitoxin domain-containing protein n=1 Tax=Natrinema sp. 1APR25-10V2 TaxID=2951081 RepID=UPI0028746D62|nr:type IV toxin-antitoxin system AbiEi family antitoxin domain-containing protein [Natrinema sp. 1APR25-10V2]MDS0478555.1 hypothetical protein [Natrinema sp. 1APR25-10V2]
MDDSTNDADPESDPDSERDADPDADGELKDEETDAEWMHPVDRPILELFHSDEDVFEPSDIEAEGLCRGNYAAFRCRELTKYGLLEKLIPGVYELADAGEQYLADELDPSELEPEE